MKREILKLLQKIHRMRNKPDLHSFKAKIKGGEVYVEAELDAFFMVFSYYDEEGKENHKRYAVSKIYAAADMLEHWGLDLATVET